MSNFNEYQAKVINNLKKNNNTANNIIILLEVFITKDVTKSVILYTEVTILFLPVKLLF